MSTEERKPYVKRVWSQQLHGYTYDNIVLSACQHYPLCAEGRKEREAHLKKEADSGS